MSVPATVGVGVGVVDAVVATSGSGTDSGAVTDSVG